MDIQPQTTKPISDDQELAKVLAGVSQITDNNLGFEEEPKPTVLPTPDPVKAPIINEIKQPPVAEYKEPVNIPPSNNSGNLEDIKKNALIELRPLVDKLDLAPEEKFDIYLLLLRSTDDTTLIEPAHEAARNIADETKRAQALLDVIKEIDYLSNPS